MNIQFIESLKGPLTARVQLPNGNSIFLHSKYDPQKEAEKLVDQCNLDNAGTIVVMGLGLGYHVKEIKNRIDKNVPILILENNDELIKKYTKKEGLPNKCYIAKNEKQIISFLDLEMSSLRNGKIIFFEHKTSCKANPSFYHEMLQKFRDYSSTILLNINTSKKFNYRFQENICKCIPKMVYDPGINVINDTFKNKPAVIIAAGPSLDKNIHLLRKVKEKALLICVGTALKAVLKTGISPDLVITIDPGEKNLENFNELPDYNYYLFYEPQTHYKILDKFKKRFVYVCKTPYLEYWFSKLCGGKGVLPRGGSVAILAYGLAHFLQANPIIFIGQDLAYTNYNTHASGTIYDGKKIRPNKSKDMLEVPSVYGDTVLTSRSLYSFLVKFESLFKETDRLIIDATEGGAFIKGTRVMSFQKAIDTYCKEKINTTKKLDQIYKNYKPDRQKIKKTRQKLTELISRYNNYRNELRSAIELIKKIREIHKSTIKSSNKSSKMWISYINKLGKELQNKIKSIQSETELKSLLHLLTDDLKFFKPLPKNSTLEKKLERADILCGTLFAATETFLNQLNTIVKQINLNN